MSCKVERGTDLTKEAFPEHPWMHEEVVQWLSGRVSYRSRVLEIGAGGSTVWFARLTPHLTSIEHDPKWYNAVNEHLISLKLNAVVLYRPHYPTEGLAFTPAHMFDIVLVDGEGYTRSKQIHDVLPLVKPGGWLILDDAQRPSYNLGIREAAVKSSFTIEFSDSQSNDKTIAWRL